MRTEVRCQQNPRMLLGWVEHNYKLVCGQRYAFFPLQELIWPAPYTVQQDAVKLIYLEADIYYSKHAKCLAFKDGGLTVAQLKLIKGFILKGRITNES